MTRDSIALGAASMALVATYPLAKRYTNYPQLILGLTFNWGALLGWTAQLGSLDTTGLMVTLPLYTAGVCWTLIYDTIYAHQDKIDDTKIGVKSTALTFGDRTKPVSYALDVIMLGLLSVSGMCNEQGLTYWISVFASSAYTAKIIRDVDLNDSQSCLRAFRRSQFSGWLITAGLVSDIFLS
jgi:4-hydroxybenzoate polyprenyltransferase